MTSAQVVETSVNVISNSPSQDYTHPDDRTLLYDMTPGFKPFTSLFLVIYFSTMQLHTCPGSCRLCGFSVVAIWSHVGKNIERSLLFL